ncbi:MAG: flavodoxin family protein [Spirochaetes bacterium]|nr:flavodoxin family protein [Spirochaetota bacterium]
MNIVILNGNPDPNARELERYIDALTAELAAKGHEVNAHTLRDMNIRSCTGCWSCWVKTPGMCAQHDDMPVVYTSVMAADLVLFASPIIMGFVSALLKRANERFIPLIHPYLVIDRGECHHLKRYTRYPELGLILHKGADADDEDIKITSDIYARIALNFKTTLRFSIQTSQPIQEALHAIAAA